MQAEIGQVQGDQGVEQHHRRGQPPWRSFADKDEYRSDFLHLDPDASNLPKSEAAGSEIRAAFWQKDFREPVSSIQSMAEGWPP